MVGENKLLKFKFFIYVVFIALIIIQLVVTLIKKRKIKEKYDKVNEELWGNKEGCRRKYFIKKCDLLWLI